MEQCIPTPNDSNNLPILNISEDFSDAMGFEGYLAYSIDELTSANPWREDQNITQLPVINNALITATEALKLLKSKNYITTVPEKFPGTQYVKKVELIYRNETWAEIYMPYYKFYVELPSMKMENGLITYGAFYVPAVQGKYIDNMPLWDLAAFLKNPALSLKEL